MTGHHIIDSDPACKMTKAKSVTAVSFECHVTKFNTFIKY